MWLTSFTWDHVLLAVCSVTPITTWSFSMRAINCSSSVMESHYRVLAPLISLFCSPLNYNGMRFNVYGLVGYNQSPHGSRRLLLKKYSSLDMISYSIEVKYTTTYEIYDSRDFKNVRGRCRVYEL